MEQGTCLIVVHPKVANNIHYLFYYSIKSPFVIGQWVIWDKQKFFILEGCEPPVTTLLLGHGFCYYPLLVNYEI